MFLFNPEDFVLPLEQQFKFRKIKDEVNACQDVEELKKQTIKAAELVMNYQHLLRKAVTELVECKIEVSPELTNNDDKECV
tara:strand:+ start:158 stop:400 length:243 start_codon:yes stop_codon:yes gene_type:complete